MAQDFTMPKLGLTMTEGTIREWLVPAGAKVLTGDPVLIIETDKVETEIQARADGIWQPSAAIGETYECGAVIGWLLEDDEQPAEGSDSARPSAAVQAAFPTVVTSPTLESESEVSAVSVSKTSVAADVAVRGEGGRILASPRARAAARVGDVELAQVAGTGPGGRILFADVQSFSSSSGCAHAGPGGGAGCFHAGPGRRAGCAHSWYPAEEPAVSTLAHGRRAG